MSFHSHPHSETPPCYRLYHVWAELSGADAAEDHQRRPCNPELPCRGLPCNPKCPVHQHVQTWMQAIADYIEVTALRMTKTHPEILPAWREHGILPPAEPLEASEWPLWRQRAIEALLLGDN